MTDKSIEDILKKQDDQPEGLQFPCEHPVKAMGPNTEKFRQEILFIVQKHCEEVEETHMRWSLSRTGKYQSVTVELVAKTREHLEGIYAEIKSHQDVKWTL